VRAVVEMFVATFVTVITTPGTTALFGSVTVPVSVERMVWAAAAEAAAALSTRTSLVTVRQRALELGVSFAMMDPDRKAMRCGRFRPGASRVVPGAAPLS
jgi:hypothetical protein